MRKADRIRIQHMLDSAKEAISFVQNRTRDDLDSDRMLTLSIVKSIEIIGEAASKITEEAKEQMQEVPWSDITGMRNRLIHGYFDINLDIVWNTITEDLPQLISILDKIASEKDE